MYVYIYIYIHIHIYIYIHLSVLIPNKIEQYFQNILSEVTVRFPTKKTSFQLFHDFSLLGTAMGRGTFHPGPVKNRCPPGCSKNMAAQPGVFFKLSTRSSPSKTYISWESWGSHIQWQYNGMYKDKNSNTVVVLLRIMTIYILIIHIHAEYHVYIDLHHLTPIFHCVVSGSSVCL